MIGKLPPHVDHRHPVVLQEYAVFTPPVAEMAEKLGDWIDQKQPGGYIYGPSRFGKSRGIKWHVRSILEERFGKNIPLHFWTRPPESHVSESEFWQALLIAAGHRYAKARATRADRRHMLQEFLISSAKISGGNYVVLLTDEAQAMTVREWNWLLGLHNALDWAGYRLSVFCVASHQMDYQYQLLARADYAHVAARFLVAHWRFPGLASEEELEFVLQGYDTVSEWPRESGTSYLAHFAPTAFARGERLASCASTLWRVLDALLPPNYAGEQSFPMLHVAGAVEKTLFKLAQGMDWDDATCESAWLEVLAETHFTDHMRLVSAGLPRARG